MTLSGTTRSIALSAALLTFVAGCDDDDDNGLAPPGQTSLQVLLTDAPVDYLASASVDIGAVELVPAGDGDPVVLTEDATPGFVNLLDLAGETTEQLAEANVDAGDYSQVRMFVDSARVTLAEGLEFNDGTTERAVMVPSGAETGIELNLDPADGQPDQGPLTLEEETVMVLDFDVSESFVLQEDPGAPAGINTILFTPTIRVVMDGIAGSISGTVSTGLPDAAVVGLIATATPLEPGTLEPYQTTQGTAAVGADGSYTIHHLTPGTYVVTLNTGETLSSEPMSVQVELDEAEDRTGVDFAVGNADGTGYPGS